MKKIFSLFALIAVLSLVATACVSPTAVVQVTDTATSLPPTAKPTRTATAVPPTPTQTPTPLPPTSTPNPNAIAHFPSGQEFTVTSIDMQDADNGWALGGLIGAGDHVLSTADGGLTWTDVTPPEDAPAAGEQKTATGYFQDAKTAWVIYSNTSGATPAQPVVWRTADAGATWQSSQPLDVKDLNEFYNPSELQLVDGKAGWLLVHVGVGMNHDYIVLYRTNDGGLSWERLIDPYNDTNSIMGCQKTGMLFTDETHGWLTGDCNGVAAGVLLFQTSDGGATWAKVTLPEPSSAPGLFSNALAACGAYDPFFWSNDLGRMAVNCAMFDKDPITHQYYVYTTQDGGKTWTSTTYPGEALYFLTPDVGWALSNTIQHTTDGGATWKPLAQVDWSVKVDFVTDQLGWGIARTGNLVALVKTSDGGSHWALLTTKTR